MQHVDGLLEPHGVNGSIGIGLVRFDDLQHTWAKSLPGSLEAPS
jgi:hypothetical protein